MLVSKDRFASHGGSLPVLASSDYNEQQPKSWRKQKRSVAKTVSLILGLVYLLDFASNNSSSPSSNRMLSVVRVLCQGVMYQGNIKKDPYWEKSYPAKNFYEGEARKLPSGSQNVGFVITLGSCPDDSSYKKGIDTSYDPGHSLYDAAAVLKHSIDENLQQTSKYNFTMHAIVHPDAVICRDPNMNLYDRVKVLENLGYYVNIQASPIDPSNAIAPFVADNLDTDAGNRDLTPLHAAKYTGHPMVVLINFNTAVMDKPLDDIFDEFIADEKAKVAFSMSPNIPSVISMEFVLMKPDPSLVEALSDAYMKTPYDATNGWDNSGMGYFPGALGMQGILTHYFVNVEPESRITLDRCTYGNDHKDDCVFTPLEDIAVAKISPCGSPWTCPDSTPSMSQSEQEKCDSIEQHWYTMRKDFEETCFIGPPLGPRDGKFKEDVTLGFCDTKGILGYKHLIDDKPAPLSCDTETHTTSATGVLAFGEGSSYQNQKLTLTTGVHTGQPEVCVSGRIVQENFEPPYNIAIVIDVSGSTAQYFGGTPTGDVNNDGRWNRILDAEIASVLEMLKTVADSDGLGNHNVAIGLVQFSTHAQYLGMFDPCDPDDPTKINPILKSRLLRLRSGGYTHFDDALDKAIEFYQEAPKDRSNLMVFLSDGIPNVPGDGDNEEHIHYANNHPSALMYDSELVVLDDFKVHRIAIGVGSGSDVRDGYGLDMIDNTPDELTGKKAKQVTTTDALNEVVMSNPVAGNVVAFQVEVNGVVDPDFGVEQFNSGFSGFEYGMFIVGGLIPLFGNVNKVKVTATVDYDGNIATTEDQLTLTTENIVIGGLL